MPPSSLILRDTNTYSLSVIDSAQGKIVRKQFLGEGSEIRCQTEIKKARKLSGHNGFAVLVAEGCDFYDREFIHGTDLSYLVGKLELESLIELTVQVSRLVSFAHQTGLLLVDIKPENFIRTEKDRIVFVDYSLVNELENTSSIMGGSLAYMAPERLSGGNATRSSDMYAVGVTLYELTTGHRPFAGTSLADLAEQVWFEEPRSPALARGWPASWGALILHLMAKKSWERLSHASDIIRFINTELERNEILEPETAAAATLAKRHPDWAGWKNQTLALAHALSKNAAVETPWVTVARLFAEAAAWDELTSALPHLPPRIRLMHEAQMHLRTGKNDAAEALAKSLWQEGEWKALNVLGTCAYHRQDMTAARDAYTRLVAHFMEENHPLDAVPVLSNLGHACVALGDTAAAEEAYQQALSLARLSGHPRHEALALSALGYFLHTQGRWGRALGAYAQATQLCNWLGLKDLAFGPRLNSCNLLILTGNTLRAEMILNELRSQEIENTQHTLQIHLLYGDLYRTQKKQQAAREEYEQALLQAQELGRLEDAETARIGLVRNKPQPSSATKSKQHWWYQLHQLSQGQAEAATWVANTLEADPAKWDVEERLSACFLLAKHHAQHRNSELCEKYSQEMQRLLNTAAEGLADDTEKKFRSLWSLAPNTDVQAPLALALVELSTEIISNLNTHEVLRHILDKLLAITRAERGFILLRQDTGAVRVALSRHITQKDLSSEDEISWSLANQVLSSARAIVTLDAPHDQRLELTRSMHELRLKTIICLPFVYQGQALGAIYLDSRHHEVSASEDWAGRLAPFAAQMAVAIWNARLFEKKEVSIKNAERELHQLRSQIDNEGQEVSGMIYRSPQLHELVALTRRIAAASIPVLISGESGVGKEKFARLIHEASPRRDKKFVTINCGAIPENLLESELFGFRKGAFTGADRDRKGLMAVADGGTLFLDEIGELPLPLQVKLLRVLQEKEFMPLGSEQVVKTNIRIVTATNRDLASEVALKKFREDLYYRLNVAPLPIPPLRERREDIPLLVQHFVRTFCTKENLKLRKISPTIMERLQNHNWPGNVRELENFIYKLVVFSPDEKIDHLPFALTATPASEATVPSEALIDARRGLSRAKKDFEKRQIELALQRFHGNVSHAAEYLKIARPRLSLLLSEHHIQRERFQR